MARKLQPISHHPWWPSRVTGHSPAANDRPTSGRIKSAAFSPYVRRGSGLYAGEDSLALRHSSHLARVSVGRSVNPRHRSWFWSANISRASVARQVAVPDSPPHISAYASTRVILQETEVVTVRTKKKNKTDVITGVPRGEVLVDSQPPPIESVAFLNCVFAKYTVQALLLYSLNPTFSTGKR